MPKLSLFRENMPISIEQNLMFILMIMELFNFWSKIVVKWELHFR